jgi:hypothetical protein
MPYADRETYKDPEKARKMVFRAVKKSREAFAPLRDEQWVRAFLYYHSKHDPTAFQKAVYATGDSSYPYDVKIFYPTITEQVETQTPRLVRSLLANDPFMRAEPVMTTDDMGRQAELEGYAERAGQLIQEQLLSPECVQLRRHMAPWVRDAKIFGIKWLFIDWVYREGDDWYQKLVAPGRWEYTKRDNPEVLEDHIRVVGKSPWDVHPDPRGASVHGRGAAPGCRYIATEGVEDIDRIWGWVKSHPEKNWWYKRRDPKNPSRSTKSESDAYNELKKLQGQVKSDWDKQRELLAKVGQLAESADAGDENRRLIHYTDYHEPRGGNHILVFGEEQGKSLCALIEPAPIRKLGLPFVAIRPIPLDGQLYTRGVPGLVEGLVHVINAMVNLRLHDLIRSVHPLMLVNTQAGISADDILYQGVPVLNIDGSVPTKEALHIHSYPPANNEAFLEVDNMEDHLRKAAGGTVETMGGGQETKYQPWRSTEAFIQQVGARFALESSQVAEDFAELGWAMHQVNRQMITAPRLVRLHGAAAQPEMGRRNAYRRVTPEDLDRDIEIYFDARPEAANPTALAGRMLEWGKVVFQLPEFKRSKFIVDYGNVLGVPRSEQYVEAPSRKPEHENHYFRQVGEMPFVSRKDAHGYHLLVHDQIVTDGTLEMMGEEAKDSFAGHVKSHRQYQQRQRAAPPRGFNAPVPTGGRR